ncbi:aminodeoxychorismate lyase [Clostridium pasteurianum DSM 525 = ATCC 6013]|uniref:Aminodeoxychorismate lyase n=1 Tax=Clostridium pasteurianum DSM 525 = ATCC 6013 TaxID=1262449 RepID=A0A0H3J4P1_CLOPA|nr:aminotransferase class IV [Clostridium pasteurianum]AJA47947.1 aminodeoxychorismate lyase [Clostridium pasteurianum DSM 525 = ATCC 6013]AJA51935.1 aminodeoxychorismate lyase [Clostridium pasteurianum DSM 525 = ATCC 6013]AOZ75234.1 4-amino-4-deoxychorismate lyase [Clostridium pasteurianum DSM 525 = ATCC 6013]AOZ79029.1 4-amino-4-deoxychorismate lyase [Clostridium pasteurianum]ELP59850.1 4-amino-4-deoxychorismate lyase [Clostridium pasteurianum DSM 525 = ATCC 6013]
MLINGRLKEDIIYADNGFFFGEGLFETMRVSNNSILFLEEHLERINSGLKILGINKKMSKEYIINSAEKLKCRDGVLKLAVSEKNDIVVCRDNNYTEDMYSRGFKLKISKLRRNKYSIITYLKSLNYLDNILEHRRCKEEGYDEVLFLNLEDEITEGSISNVFFIRDKKIYTPSVDCGLLDGTIRKYILKNYSVVQGKFTKENLIEADEIFLTNSVMGIMPVCQFENIFFEEKVLTCSIMSTYSSYVKGLYQRG